MSAIDGEDSPLAAIARAFKPRLSQGRPPLVTARVPHAIITLGAPLPRRWPSVSVDCMSKALKGLRNSRRCLHRSCYRRVGHPAGQLGLGQYPQLRFMSCPRLGMKPKKRAGGTGDTCGRSHPKPVWPTADRVDSCTEQRGVPHLLGAASTLDEYLLQGLLHPWFNPASFCDRTLKTSWRSEL